MWVPAQAGAQFAHSLREPALGDVEARQVGVAERAGRIPFDPLLDQRPTACNSRGVLRAQAIPPRLRAGLKRVEGLPTPQDRRLLNADGRVRARGRRQRPVGSVHLDPPDHSGNERRAGEHRSERGEYVRPRAPHLVGQPPRPAARRSWRAARRRRHQHDRYGHGRIQRTDEQEDRRGGKVAQAREAELARRGSSVLLPSLRRKSSWPRDPDEQDGERRSQKKSRHAGGRGHEKRQRMWIAGQRPWLADAILWRAVQPIGDDEGARADAGERSLHHAGHSLTPQGDAKGVRARETPRLAADARQQTGVAFGHQPVAKRHHEHGHTH